MFDVAVGTAVEPPSKLKRTRRKVTGAGPVTAQCRMSRGFGKIPTSFLSFFSFVWRIYDPFPSLPSLRPILPHSSLRETQNPLMQGKRVPTYRAAISPYKRHDSRETLGISAHLFPNRRSSGFSRHQTSRQGSGRKHLTAERMRSSHLFGGLSIRRSQVSLPIPDHNPISINLVKEVLPFSHVAAFIKGFTLQYVSETPSKL